MPNLTSDEERLLEVLLLLQALPGLCERGVERVSSDTLQKLGLSANQLATRIAEVVKRNLLSERVMRVMVKSKQHKSLSVPVLESYVKRVIPYYIKESPRVIALTNNDQRAWAELREWLVKRTYSTFLRRLNTSEASAPDAQDFAQEACGVLVEKLPTYHYDAAFDAWVTVILRHIVWKPYTRGRDIIDRRSNVASIDKAIQSGVPESVSLLALLTDPSQSTAFEQVETRMLLADTLARLNSEAQRAVIIYTFFDDLSDTQIGEKLGKSPNNVAQLRYRGLARLRKILEAE